MTLIDEMWGIALLMVFIFPPFIRFSNLMTDWPSVLLMSITTMCCYRKPATPLLVSPVSPAFKAATYEVHPFFHSYPNTLKQLSAVFMHCTSILLDFFFKLLFGLSAIVATVT